MDESARARLGRWMGTVLPGADGPVAILRAERLHGGAIQENWLVEAEHAGRAAGFVVRRDAAAAIGASHSREVEFAILQAARRAGVTVPEPIAFCRDAAVLGGPFALLARVEGVGFGPRVVRDLSLGGDREALARRLGAELATLHKVTPETAAPGLEALGPPPRDPALAEVDAMRRALDRLGATRPALEWGLRWAQTTAPGPSANLPPVALAHRDFRTGNYMVDHAGLTAVLDWEFAGWSDPLSDLGWFCAACWRFGRADLEAGGVGSRAAFYAGYEAASGLGPVDDARVRWWEVVAHLRWAVIALEQGERHRSGAEPSLALALTGRIAAELELAALRETAPARWRAHADA